MSGDGVLLDSVIVIDHFNGIERATEFMSGLGDRARLSAITRAEVLAGLDDPALDLARRLLDRFPCWLSTVLSPTSLQPSDDSGHGGCPMLYRRRSRSTTVSNWLHETRAPSTRLATRSSSFLTRSPDRARS
jgi:hypothetical protein